MPLNRLKQAHTSPVPFWGRASVRIALMFYIVLIPLLAVDVYFTIERRSDVVQQIYGDLELVSSVIATQQSVYVSAGRDLLLALGQIEDIRTGSDAECSELLQRVSRQYERYTVFSRVDADGFINCNSTDTIMRINVKNSENISNAIQNKGFALSPFIIGPISGKPVVVFSSAMTDSQGDVIGLVNTGLSLDWVTGLLDEISLPSDIRLTIFDGDGTLLAQHPNQGHSPGDSLLGRPEVTRILKGQNQGQGEVMSGRDRVYFSHTNVPDVPGELHIMASIPASKVSSALNQNTLFHLIGVFSVLILSVVFARFMTEHVVLNGISALSAHADRVTKGSLDSRTGYPHTDTDIGRLAETYDRMTEQIESNTRELSYRNQLLNAQQEASSEGILVVDNDHRVRLFNRRFTEMWGLPDNLDNAACGNLLYSVAEMVKDTKAFNDRIVYLYQNLDEESVGEEVELVDGRVLERYSKGMSDDNGVYWGRIWFYRDITEQKRAERTIKEFIATASHELRTPLTAIRGAVGLLVGGVGGEMTEQGKQLIGVAASNTERLIALVNDILDVEKIEQGKIDLSFETLPLGALITESVQANRPYAVRYGVELETTGDAEGIEVSVDRNRFLQIMANLLSNAAKFSESGQTVTISAEQADGMALISVIDRGRGIPDAFRLRVFEKFAQEDSSDARRRGGTGLGLSITRSLVNLLGGEISFTSVHGEGTTFTFALPVVSTEDAE